jgi:hypothetical protein
MDADPSWPFERYQAYERDRLRQSLAEQEQARAGGLVTDPKSEPHGGYRIACVWPDEVTGPAFALSGRLAGLLPGTPAYPHEAVHSSVGNIAAPDGRLVDPVHNAEDRAVLDRLADVTAAALAGAAGDVSRAVAFGPALLAPRMALVFGRPGRGYWTLHQAVHVACASQSIQLVPSWGPHLTLTRFGRPATPSQAALVLGELSGWAPVSATPSALLVGWYTVGPGSFRVDCHRLLTLG